MTNSNTSALALTVDKSGNRLHEINDLLMPIVEPVAKAFATRHRLAGDHFTKETFYRICSKENIQVANGPMFKFMADHAQVLGACMRIPNADGSKTTAIYLRSLFRPPEEPFCSRTALHEFGHYELLHAGAKPTESFLLKRRAEMPDKGQQEYEADLFADLVAQVLRSN